MEKIARDFYKEESINFSSLEEKTIFFIDNYPLIMKKYRLIKKKNEEVKAEKKWAHEELQKLRERMNIINKAKLTLTEQEKIELEETKTFLQNIRDNDQVIIDENGNEIMLDETTFFIKYPYLMDKIEKIDFSVRSILYKTITKPIDLIQRPATDYLKYKIKRTKAGWKKEFFKETKRLINNLPVKAKNFIMP